MSSSVARGAIELLRRFAGHGTVLLESKKMSDSKYPPFGAHLIVFEDWRRIARAPHALIYAEMRRMSGRTSLRTSAYLGNAQAAYSTPLT